MTNILTWADLLRVAIKKRRYKRRYSFFTFHILNSSNYRLYAICYHLYLTFLFIPIRERGILKKCEWLESTRIVNFLPVFGCLGYSVLNCIPTIYSVVMGSSFFLTKTFQPREWSRACVCGVAPKTTPEAEKSRLEQKNNPKIKV